MAFRWGFKSEANRLASEARAELGLDPLDRLDPRDLSSRLDIAVIHLSDLVVDAPEAACLMCSEREAFSAVTVFCGTQRTIVHNDMHAITRQNSNLAHELAHALLQHAPSAALDSSGCRIWRQDIEDEAEWLAGVLLVTEAAAIAVAQGRWSRPDAASRFQVSGKMIDYRLNATGAFKRVARTRTARSRRRA